MTRYLDIATSEMVKSKASRRWLDGWSVCATFTGISAYRYGDRSGEDLYAKFASAGLFSNSNMRRPRLEGGMARRRLGTTPRNRYPTPCCLTSR